MKQNSRTWIAVLLMAILLPALSFGAGIKASAAPASAAVTEQALAVPVTVDISNLPEKLGSYTATLRWDSRVLKYTGYQPGTTAGFSAPVVNSAKADEGLITFAAANPYGAEGSINILNAMFEVIGAEGSKSELKLEFSAMAAAGTFTNLLPYVNTTLTGVEQNVTVGEQPKEFALKQNYPNPFNPSTRIGFSLPKAEQVTITIYNALGQKVKRLVDERKALGTHVTIWDGRDDAGREVPAGVYLYRMHAGSFTSMKQMLFVK